MEPARRLNGIDEYYFSKKLRQIEELNREGKDVINLGIGSPDLPPHPIVIECLHQEALNPGQHGYQNYKGHISLREAIARWYSKSYDVTLDPGSEILPLIGSKEGLMHICMSFINDGDQVLIPNPGYPSYRSVSTLAGATCVEYSLTEKNGWFPDIEGLEQMDLSKIKLMFLNYPHMPTGQLPTKELFINLIAFARRHQILICHDNPYSFILNSTPSSMLSIEGATDVVIELNSLSKSHNMAGWRVGMLLGKEKYISLVLRFKSNMDSGMFLPVQKAASKALELGEEWFRELNEIYLSRRTKMFDLLKLLGCSYDEGQAGMFVWARIPADKLDSYQYSDEILLNLNVFLTPGSIFGSEGEQYLRASLCTKEERIVEAIDRISEYYIRLGQEFITITSINKN